MKIGGAITPEIAHARLPVKPGLRAPPASGDEAISGRAEVSLQDLVRAVWQAKWLVLALTISFTAAAGIAAILVPKTYRASVVVSAVSSTTGTQAGVLGSLASQFSGLASLAGLSGASDSKRAESLAVLQSETLTQQYIQDNKLLPVLYASKWDNKLSRWKTMDPGEIPTLWKANLYFKKNVRTVDIDAKTGLVTLTISWKDPRVAAEWANGLIKLTNDYLRQTALEESERNIAYLNEQAERTSVVGAKQAIYTLLEAEINKEMIARGSKDYALKFIDRAFPPERPYSPQIALWLLLGSAGGFFLGMIVSFIRAS